MSDNLTLDWNTLSVSAEWTETLLPFLDSMEAVVIEKMANRGLVHTADDFAYWQGQLAAIRQIKNAPAHFALLRKSLAENEAENEEPDGRRPGNVPARYGLRAGR